MPMYNTLSKQEATLLTRAEQIAGLSLAQIAQRFAVALPADLRRDKGFVGQLLEKCLGAGSGSLPQPDFPNLGIELKTIPLASNAQVLESTYVCTVPLPQLAQLQFTESLLWAKLRRVLWIPIIVPDNGLLAERRIAAPLLWSPTVSQMQQLRADWEEVINMISLGQLAQISSRQGNFLQIRPKAANAKAQCLAIGPNGNYIKTLPRGFYLRASFTQEIMNDAFMK